MRSRDSLQTQTRNTILPTCFRHLLTPYLLSGPRPKRRSKLARRLCRGSPRDRCRNSANKSWCHHIPRASSRLHFHPLQPNLPRTWPARLGRADNSHYILILLLAMSIRRKFLTILNIRATFHLVRPPQAFLRWPPNRIQPKYTLAPRGARESRQQRRRRPFRPDPVQGLLLLSNDRNPRICRLRHTASRPFRRPFRRPSPPIQMRPNGTALRISPHGLQRWSASTPGSLLPQRLRRLLGSARLLSRLRRLP